MIRIGIQQRAARDLDRPDLQPADGERDAERDPQQHHRDRPEHVERPRDHRVDPAPVVAGEQGEEDGEEGRDQGGAEPDQQRGAAAVHQAHHLVAAEAAVGAEEELAVGAEPDRPDRGAVGADHVPLLAVDVDPFQRVRPVGPGVGDVVGPERRGEDEDDDRREEDRRGDRDRVAPQPAEGDSPGAAARHYLNWKLVRSPEKIGFQMTVVEVDVTGDEDRDRRRPVGGEAAPVPCRPGRARRIRLPARGRAVRPPAWRSSR